MANSNKSTLQTEDETQDTMDFFDDQNLGEGSSLKQKKQAINDKKRGKVRRNIEEIKERKRLQELLGDDYDDVDYLDS